MNFEAFGTWINNNAITIEGGLISGKRVSLSPYHIYIDLVNLEDINFKKINFESDLVKQAEN
ncbi:hypothetical protein [Zunongwangia profunda]|uniref:hypothetical protein n=1 Tax=Zunongwangia profunda TaxID=398743 RepID=UPI00248E855F|nr:hypothetical protein [Zunongwangia profunda]